MVKTGEGQPENDQTGFVLATSVSGVGTGERGDRVRLDDPHNSQPRATCIVDRRGPHRRRDPPAKLSDRVLRHTVSVVSACGREPVSGGFGPVSSRFRHGCGRFRQGRHRVVSRRFRPLFETIGRLQDSGAQLGPKRPKLIMRLDYPREVVIAGDQIAGHQLAPIFRKKGAGTIWLGGR
jgi:hypothetical protein